MIMIMIMIIGSLTSKRGTLRAHAFLETLLQKLILFIKLPCTLQLLHGLSVLKLPRQSNVINDFFLTGGGRGNVES